MINTRSLLSSIARILRKHVSTQSREKFRKTRHGTFCLSPVHTTRLPLRTVIQTQTLTFTLNARLDFASTPDIQKDFNKYWAEYPTHDTIVDFSSVQFCDSAGLALLLEIKKYCVRTHVRCYFHNVTAPVTALATFYNMEHILNHDNP